MDCYLLNHENKVGKLSGSAITDSTKSQLVLQPTPVSVGGKTQWVYMESWQLERRLKDFEQKEFQDLLRRIQRMVEERGPSVFRIPKWKGKFASKAHAVLARNYLLEVLKRQ